MTSISGDDMPPLWRNVIILTWLLQNCTIHPKQLKELSPLQIWMPNCLRRKYLCSEVSLMACEDRCVVIVSDDDGTALMLWKILKEVGIQVRIVRTCAEARHLLDEQNSPVVLFSDTSLPDGTWADVLTLATEGKRQIPVIVVSRVVDINLYISALEKGASDFIVPPFYGQDISHVLKCAIKHHVVEERLAAA